MFIMDKKELALKTAGITREENFKSIREHLNAVIVEKKFVDGQFIETITPNYAVQEKAQEKILRIMGDVKPSDTAGITITHQISCSKEEAEKLIELSRLRNQKLTELALSGRQTGKIIDVSP